MFLQYWLCNRVVSIYRMYICRDQFLRRLEVREWQKRNNKDVLSVIEGLSADSDIYSTGEGQPTSEGDTDSQLFNFFSSITLPQANLRCLA